MQRHQDWLKQAKKDADAAGASLSAGHYEWVCFQAHQSAEKAVKALCEYRRVDAWGHVITKLLTSLSQIVKIPNEIIDHAKVLDRYYIPARYPNSFESGSPMDYYSKKDAEEAVSYAKNIIEFCERNIQ